MKSLGITTSILLWILSAIPFANATPEQIPGVELKNYDNKGIYLDLSKTKEENAIYYGTGFVDITIDGNKNAIKDTVSSQIPESEANKLNLVSNFIDEKKASIIERKKGINTYDSSDGSVHLFTMSIDAYNKKSFITNYLESKTNDFTIRGDTEDYTKFIDTNNGVVIYYKISYVPVVATVSAPVPLCSTPPVNANASFSTFNPVSENQSWVKDAVSCGFTCINGYTGNSCEIAPADITPPNAPTSEVYSPYINAENYSLGIYGEVGAKIFVGGVDSGRVIQVNGFQYAPLDTSGADGGKSFEITLVDSSGNDSIPLMVNFIKSVVAPTSVNFSGLVPDMMGTMYTSLVLVGDISFIGSSINISSTNGGIISNITISGGGNIVFDYETPFIDDTLMIEGTDRYGNLISIAKFVELPY